MALAGAGPEHDIAQHVKSVTRHEHEGDTARHITVGLGCAWATIFGDQHETAYDTIFGSQRHVVGPRAGTLGWHVGHGTKHGPQTHHVEQPMAFDPLDCPLDCSIPCEAVCPANAITLIKGDSLEGGVINERCYGCGRCLPVCPYDNIKAVTYWRDAVTTAQLVRRNDVDAIEIHTNGRQIASFEDLWNGLGDSTSHLRLVAISLPDVGKSTTTLMSAMFSIMRPNLSCYNLWQLDGRPMSGDIGRGATREALAFAVRLAAAEDRPPGFL